MLRKNNSFYIKGSGFKSIVFALGLRKKFPKAKILIEKNSFFGGIYSSIEHKNFYLDIGCHLFDLTDKKFNELFEISKSKIIPIKLNYKTINNFGSTNGFAVYDFRKHKNIQILQRSFLNNLKTKKKNIKNLYQKYENKFGKKIPKIIDKFCSKITGKNLKDINKNSDEFFMFERILLFNTKNSLELKQKGLQNYLVTPSKYNHDYSQGKIIFTFKRGTNGFVKHVLGLFRKKKILFSNKIQKKKFQIIDPNKNHKIFEKKALNIPLHLVYLQCKSFPYTYFHDFSESPVFRVSSPGFYSNQKLKRLSYICIEIPDPMFQYNKDFLIKYTIQYIKKYTNSTYLHYVFTKKSYPSIYKKFNSNHKNYIDPFIYSKKKLVSNILDYINEI